MIEIPLDRAATLLRGALSVDRTSTGIVPVRLPEWAVAQAPDAFSREIFRFSSGIRLALTTEASELELDVAASQFGIQGLEELIPPRPLVFDLLVDGREEAQQTADRWSSRIFDLDWELVDATPDLPVTLRFDGLPPTRKALELWFPANGAVELRGLRADAGVDVSPETRPRWIHHGSSISHCMEAASPTRTWPAVAARLGGMDLLSLGFGGNCQLDQFVARTIRDLPAALISLKVGINICLADSFKFRTFGPAVHGFLDTIREGQPETPILVVSPVICPLVEDQPGPVLPDGEGGITVPPPVQPSKNTLGLRRMREILAEIVDARTSTDLNLRYLDGLTLFGEGDLDDLPDGVHPNGDGYVRMGERFAAAVFADRQLEVTA